MEFTAVKDSLPRRRGLVGRLMEESLAGMKRRRAILGYLFVLPTLLGILVFTAGPVVVSLGLSLFEWNVIEPASFIGLQNYQRLLGDATVQASFVNTIKFVVLSLVLQITLGLLLALGVENSKIGQRLRYYFRSAFYLPSLVAAATISVVMSYLFHTDFGAVNYYLGLLGAPRIGWLTSRRWALLTIVLTHVWQQAGFCFILFLGGLGNIPEDVMDAAKVDGAVGWRRLWHITIPLISPTLMFAAVVQAISALQVFAQPFVLTRGGPGDASRTAVMVIYQSAFKNLEIGYGSAVAMLLFLLILIVTAIQFWLSKRWVFYQ